MSNNLAPHVSVMMNEVISAIAPHDGGNYLDFTFGAGGHSSAILGAASCNLVAVDRDQSCIQFADKLMEKYPDRFAFYNDTFASAAHKLKEDKAVFDGILLDLGVSSMQIDNPERGFSFAKNGELLMTMGCNKITAFDVVNGYSENMLADIFFNYSDERHSRKIARTIVEFRSKSAITTTGELSKIVLIALFGRHRNISDYGNFDSYLDSSSSSKSPDDKRIIGDVGASSSRIRGRIHPATKVFQAIRMEVNDELGELKKVLPISLEMLSIGGILCIISFHSTEDRIVKHFAKTECTQRIHENKFKKSSSSEKKSLTKEFISIKNNMSSIAPSEEEVRANCRARSAKCRVIKRIK